MTRWLGLCLAVYAPHLLEEALTRMYDDPLIVYAFEPLSHLSTRHSTYLVFQMMLAVALGMTFLFSLGDGPVSPSWRSSRSRWFANRTTPRERSGRSGTTQG